MTTNDTNFNATGPAAVGLRARGRGAQALHIGVEGVASPRDPAVAEDLIGVLGSTTDFRGFDNTGDGIGVRGVSNLGTGVQGESLAGGIGVEGLSNGFGPGVSGRSAGRGSGVEGDSNEGVGVSGRGGLIGVRGTSGLVGVLGGVQQGRAFDPDEGPFGLGVVGVSIGDVRAGDLQFAYGGWFDAANGTAPVHLEPSAADGPPLAAMRGDLFVDNGGVLWFCTDSGDSNPNNATWKQVQLV